MFNKLLSNVKGDAKKSDEDDEISEAIESESGGDEDEKKKKKSMIIKVVVIVGLAYLALDSFMNPQTSQNEVAVAPVIKKRKKPKKDLNKDNVNKEAEKKDEAKAGETQTAETPKPEGAPMASPAGANDSVAVENINVEKSLNGTEASKAPAEHSPNSPPEAAPEQANQTTPNPEMDKAIGDLSATVNPSETANVPAPAEEPKVEPRVEAPVLNPDSTTNPAATTALANEAPAEAPAAAVPVFNEPYSPPPSYEEFGRGLVYNCKESHWSCVNRLAYVACNKNTQWSRGAGKAPECVVQNIYKSDDDCSKMQRYYVANNKDTSFCK
jgi:hypothetical protein